ncbi:MAG: hypothetical protein M1351_06520 [Candidatus Thermoplasmatota archaeon]|nr:hypothetical protein [Candidatus Thermoplasmatota archaeon]
MDSFKIKVLSFIDTFREIDLYGLKEAMETGRDKHPLRRLNRAIVDLLTLGLVVQRFKRDIPHFSLTLKGKETLSNLKPMPVVPFEDQSTLRRIKFLAEDPVEFTGFWERCD